MIPAINLYLERILTEINSKSISVKIDFESKLWHLQIPSSLGWCTIKTNTPIKILAGLDAPEGESHYKIAGRVLRANTFKPSYFIIKQVKSDCLYVVYNGHRDNLKARAREHDRGHSKTGCLALRQYSILHEYSWYFEYYTVEMVEDYIRNFQDDKVLRNVVEQAWRTINGWPILCQE